MNLSLRRMALSGFAAWMAVLVVAIYILTPLREKLRLGIDLVGGTYITLEVKTEKAVESALLDYAEDLTKKLDKAGKVQPLARDVSNNEIVLTFKSASDAQSAASLLKTVDQRSLTMRSDGNSLIFSLHERERKRIEKDAVERNREVLHNRLDKMSVAEINIASQGERNIIVELPDVSDPQQAKAMIGTAAILEFKLVERTGDSQDDILYEYDGVIPPGMEIVTGNEHGNVKYYLVSKRAPITGKDLRDAKPQIDQERGVLDVSFFMTPDGGRKFADLTGRNYHKVLAAILDGNVITAATIQGKIDTNGRIMRDGGFPKEEAKELALLLKSGSFVAPVTFEEERQVGPTLGAEAIRQGIIACLVALALLFLFSVVFYKVAGLLAFITLLYNLVLILLGLVWLNATLTLPGIAGMVLTVGMAIDASILIYERIREELAAGTALRKAVDDGFSDAMRVILDANITTFIVGVVLYQFGTGPIQGFAVTIMLGIVATLVTGLFFLKSLFRFILDNFNIQKISI